MSGFTGDLKVIDSAIGAGLKKVNLCLKEYQP